MVSRTHRWEILVYILWSVVVATATALFATGDVPYALFGVAVVVLAFVTGSAMHS